MFLMSFPTPRAGQAFMEKILLSVISVRTLYFVSHEASQTNVFLASHKLNIILRFIDYAHDS